MSESCPTVAPGQPLTPLQRTALQLVARLHGGRDVVLAIDLTESVGLNEEGRLRLRQIVSDSLQPGDTVYVVPFASTVAPLEAPIAFKSNEDVDRIIPGIESQSDGNFRNTDIQLAELSIYQKLAQINQCRLTESQAIKPQSVVWITDAPLGTKLGSEWIETPFESPFRKENSLPSQQRRAWMQALPLQERSLSIRTKNEQVYKLTVVDIPATVQEFCTPAPGGKETCLVNAYLWGQLWLPTAGLAIGLIAILLAVKTWMSWQKKWQLIVDFDSEQEEQRCYLRHNQRIAIGEYDGNCVDAIDCPGEEVRAYLERKGNSLYLVPTGLAKIDYNGREVTQRTRLSGNQMRLNCPDGNNRDFEFAIEIKKS
ncbi:MAG: VWA domain-containing protein [Hormoscilla sp. GUM202]|nr:VWA domain-containing protein [Hormoscilla sp. GUM202]